MSALPTQAPQIRLGAFLGVLVAMMLCEIAAPARRRAVPRLGLQRMEIGIVPRARPRWTAS